MLQPSPSLDECSRNAIRPHHLPTIRCTQRANIELQAGRAERPVCTSFCCNALAAAINSRRYWDAVRGKRHALVLGVLLEVPRISTRVVVPGHSIGCAGTSFEPRAGCLHRARARAYAVRPVPAARGKVSRAAHLGDYSDKHGTYWQSCRALQLRQQSSALAVVTAAPVVTPSNLVLARN